jgi:hypothetical protein
MGIFQFYREKERQGEENSAFPIETGMLMPESGN